MDGAPWISADVAQGKAWTAAAYGAPSAAQKAKMEPMPNFASAITTMTGGKFTPQTGAVPVYSGYPSISPCLSATMETYCKVSKSQRMYAGVSLQ